jgi:DNA-binding beta-propeller fold protein YncE
MTEMATTQTAAARRVPCASCHHPILEGARKCKACKAWQPDRPRAPRAAILVAVAVTSAFSVILTSRKSSVGNAPPLTALPGDSAVSSAEPGPAAVGPDAEPKPPPPSPATKRVWKTREIKMGDVHPLDLTFSKDGTSLYVSADDATIREYRVESGEIVHKASVPAKGDRIRILFDRYVAVLRPEARVTRIPLLDTTRWDHDPILLEVGAGPGDVVEMPDGSVVVTTTASRRVSRFSLPSGKLVSDIRLPQSAGQVFLVRAEGRPYLAALGALTHAGRPAGAWLDLFDPEEAPFGSTRRSVAVGRDPRAGSITGDGSGIFFPDIATNTATLVDVRKQTAARYAEVGQGPIAAFVLAGDAHGITLNATARTASVVELRKERPSGRMPVSTLVLDGTPRDGVLSSDRTTLFVALGGAEEPPRGEGVAIIAGDPPDVLATAPTGSGAISVAVAKDGRRAAVANYFSKSLTILE